MRSFLLTAFAILPLHAEWIELFDGKSTKDWTPRAEVEQFEAINGELHLLSRTNVWVTSKIEMSDFEAELEVFLPKEPGFNSGLAFRCSGAKGKPKGYQIEIDRKAPGGIYGIGLGGWLTKKKGTLKEGQWNHFRVIAQGNRIETFVNGNPIADIREEKQLKGYFGIQHHGKGGVVKFRKIRVRKLDSKTSSLERPNILWIVAEDLSPALGCYGHPNASTPNLDAFAKESVLFTHAFAAYPVCSPSRSCLITGMYPSTTGTGQMRSAFPLPRGVIGFPQYLREAGYHTTNNVKTDYNSANAGRLTKNSWVESNSTAHWRTRKKGQPFFAVFNDMTTHQSRTMVWPHPVFKKEIQAELSPDEIHNPNKVRVPSYYPNTSLIRRELARFHDCVTLMDRNAGSILAELEKDKLTEDTIVFFYSDHGSGMPRHKRLLTDSGMRVPLMVRVPKKWQHLVPGSGDPGRKTDKLVSFVDFAPTVLALCGIDAPTYMQGHNFLDQKNKRGWVYGARDRVDEVFDCSRSVRNERWLYIRNYHPSLGWNQPSVFSDLGEIRNEITNYSLKTGMRLSSEQAHYLSPRRAPIEFYDCVADPKNTRNLALEEMSNTQRVSLEKAQRAFQRIRKQTRDVGCLPEGVMADLVKKNGEAIADLARNGKLNLDRIWNVADTVGRDAESALKFLRDDDPSINFWVITALKASRPNDKHKDDASRYVGQKSKVDASIEAAGWLAAESRYSKKAIEVLINELENPSWPVALRACRAIELLGLQAKEAVPTMKKIYSLNRHKKGDAALFLAFSSGAFLEKLGEKTKPWDFTPKR